MNIRAPRAALDGGECASRRLSDLGRPTDQCRRDRLRHAGTSPAGARRARPTRSRTPSRCRAGPDRTDADRRGRWLAQMGAVHPARSRPLERGAVALLGDAAHAMLPFAAQGAGMAIEDAAVLGRNALSGSNNDNASDDCRRAEALRAMRRARVPEGAAHGAATGPHLSSERPRPAIARDLAHSRPRPAAHAGAAELDLRLASERGVKWSAGRTAPFGRRWTPASGAGGAAAAAGVSGGDPWHRLLRQSILQDLLLAVDRNAARCDRPPRHHGTADAGLGLGHHRLLTGGTAGQTLALGSRAACSHRDRTWRDRRTPMTRFRRPARSRKRPQPGRAAQRRPPRAADCGRHGARTNMRLS